MPSKFVNIDPHAPADEDVIQAYVVQQARKAGYLVHADSNGASKTMAVASKQKIMGAMAGWPDLTFCLKNGRTAFFELKACAGKQSANQVAVERSLLDCGHIYHVVKASTPDEAWEMISKLIAPHT